VLGALTVCRRSFGYEWSSKFEDEFSGSGWNANKVLDFHKKIFAVGD
jgi:hypothetical protein